MKNLKITKLLNNELSQIRGGEEPVGGGGGVLPISCAGCLCDSDVRGQSTTNSSKASSKAG